MLTRRICVSMVVRSVLVPPRVHRVASLCCLGGHVEYVSHPPSGPSKCRHRHRLLCAFPPPGLMAFQEQMTPEKPSSNLTSPLRSWSSCSSTPPLEPKSDRLGVCPAHPVAAHAGQHRDQVFSGGPENSAVESLGRKVSISRPNHGSRGRLVRPAPAGPDDRRLELNSALSVSQATSNLGCLQLLQTTSRSPPSGIFLLLGQGRKGTSTRAPPNSLLPLHMCQVDPKRRSPAEPPGLFGPSMTSRCNKSGSPS